jgi:hypothetical protein
MKNTKRRIFIFLRAFLVVIFHTSTIFCVANDMKILAIALGIGISITWTLNVKDLAISNTFDRFCYIIGGAVGTTVSLYFLNDILQKLSV